MEILVTLVLVIAASAPWTNAGSDFLACSDQYTIQSLSQTKSAASKAAEIAAWALEALQQSTSDMIVDCGCASAKQSAMFVNAIAPKLSDDVRERVLYLLNDTKDNNWDQVKASMKDALLRYDIKSGSFFDPILDRGQKAAMFLSTYALHYVDASSLDPITDTCHYSHTTNSVALGNAKRVASSLWERFLELRAQELAAGGILYVYVPSRSSYMASIQNKARDEALQELQRQDLALSDAFSRCTIPIVYLTADERLAKIDRSVWEIALTEEASVPSAAWAKFANSGDWKGFAETIVTQAKSYTEAILRHGLNTDATDKLFELMQESLENKFKQDSAISEHDALMRKGAPKFHKLVLRRLPDSLKSNN